jgi:hypothetical protein
MVDMTQSLRQLLTDARAASGLSQAQVADRAAQATGQSAATLKTSIAVYEAHVAREPRWVTAAAVLAGLGLEIALIPAGNENRRTG